MEVSELINFLSKFEPSTRVMVRGYEGGYDDLVSAKLKDVVLDVYDEWWYGKNEVLEQVSKGNSKESIKTIILE